MQRFISELSISFKDRIEFDETKSPEEAIRKLEHFYEQSKCKNESKKDWKCNLKNKGKWFKKTGKPHYTYDKENAKLHNKFNATDKGQGF